MTHLRIKLNNGIIEEVSSEVIEKLYNIVHDNLLDNTSNLIGRLHTSATYQDYIDYLEDAFKVNGVKLLIIDATKKYIYFADPEVNRVLANKWGDGNGVTLIDMASVTALPNSLFENNKTITSFNELNKFINITSINAYVFKLCSALTSIDLSNIISIGKLAFLSCSSLTSVGDTSNITSIDDYTFLGCSLLTDIDLSNVTSIGNEAFSGCTSLTSVDLSSCISVGSSAFNSCKALTTIGNTSNLTTLSVYSFNECNALTSIDLSNVTIIPERCFWNCKLLTSLGDTSNITSIANYGFRMCYSLTTIDLSSCISIGQDAFNGCISLTNVRNTSNCTSIGNSAFRDCSLLISVGDLSNCTSIGNSTFKNCSALTNVNLSNCTSITNETFLNCSSLTSINLSNVTSIGEFAFQDCTSLTSVGDTSNITSIGRNAFLSCSSLTSINLSNCTSIGNNTFESCLALTNVNLSNVTSIGNQAFQGCTSLTSIDLSNCTSIGLLAFRYCSSLGVNLTVELTLNQTTYPIEIFSGTKFEKLIVHCLTFSQSRDGRYNISAGMSSLNYLDLSDCPYPPSNSNNNKPAFNESNNIDTVIAPPNIEVLTLLCFRDTTTRYLILLPTTPPELVLHALTPVGNHFAGSPNLEIYVPDSAKAAYLADSTWSQLGGGGRTIQDVLHGLSQLPAGVWTTGLASLYLTPAQLATS